MISRPPEATSPGASTGGAGRTSRMVRRSLRVAYRDLQLLAHNPREPFVAGAEQEAAR